MKANEVIITGRKRNREPSVAASASGTPFSRRSLANSTIRIPFLETDLSEEIVRPRTLNFAINRVVYREIAVSV
jgi:hypothetical protein